MDRVKISKFIYKSKHYAAVRLYVIISGPKVNKHTFDNKIYNVTSIFISASHIQTA